MENLQNGLDQYFSSHGKPSLSSLTNGNNRQDSSFDYDEVIERKSAEHGVDSNLVRAIIKNESNFNPNAVSPRGAVGLMQIMPGTAKHLGIDPSVPEQNIDGGVRYIKSLLDAHDGNVDLALASYNAGPKRVSDYGGVPPFKETQDYIGKVKADYRSYNQRSPKLSYEIVDGDAPASAGGGMAYEVVDIDQSKQQPEANNDDATSRKPSTPTLRGALGELGKWYSDNIAYDDTILPEAQPDVYSRTGTTEKIQRQEKGGGFLDIELPEVEQSSEMALVQTPRVNLGKQTDLQSELKKDAARQVETWRETKAQVKPNISFADQWGIIEGNLRRYGQPSIDVQDVDLNKGTGEAGLAVQLQKEGQPAYSESQIFNFKSNFFNATIGSSEKYQALPPAKQQEVKSNFLNPKWGALTDQQKAELESLLPPDWDPVDAMTFAATGGGSAIGKGGAEVARRTIGGALAYTGMIGGREGLGKVGEKIDKGYFDDTGYGRAAGELVGATLGGGLGSGASQFGKPIKDVVTHTLSGLRGFGGMEVGGALGGEAGAKVGGLAGGDSGEEYGRAIGEVAGSVGGAVAATVGPEVAKVMRNRSGQLYDTVRDRFLRTVDGGQTSTSTFEMTADEVRQMFGGQGPSHLQDPTLEAVVQYVSGNFPRLDQSRIWKEASLRGIRLTIDKGDATTTKDKAWFAAMKRLFGVEPYEATTGGWEKKSHEFGVDQRSPGETGTSPEEAPGVSPEPTTGEHLRDGKAVDALTGQPVEGPGATGYPRGGIDGGMGGVQQIPGQTNKGFPQLPGPSDDVAGVGGQGPHGPGPGDGAGPGSGGGGISIQEPGQSPQQGIVPQLPGPTNEGVPVGRPYGEVGQRPIVIPQQMRQPGPTLGLPAPGQQQQQQQQPGFDYQVVDEQQEPPVKEAANVQEEMPAEASGPAPEEQDQQGKAEGAQEEVNPIIGYIDGAINARERGNRLIEVGQQAVNGIRLQDAEEAGLMAYLVAKGNATQEEFDAWIEDALASNKVKRKKEGPDSQKETMSLMGEDASLMERSSDEGVDYDLWQGDKNFFVRVFDRDSGKIVDLTRYPSEDAAREKFTDTVNKIQSDKDNSADVIEQAANEAATSPVNDLPEPTEGQIEAGNYKKGHVNIHGLDISIENPKGSVRKGVSPNGKPWETEIHHHYGYIKGTVGKDKDHIDVFIGDNPESGHVYVVDQISPETGKFDEHKVMLGFNDVTEAKDAYLSNYEDGWDGLGDITHKSVDEFKEWLQGGETKKPMGNLAKRKTPEDEKHQPSTIDSIKAKYPKVSEGSKKLIVNNVRKLGSVEKVEANFDRDVDSHRFAREVAQVVLAEPSAPPVQTSPPAQDGKPTGTTEQPTATTTPPPAAQEQPEGQQTTAQAEVEPEQTISQAEQPEQIEQRAPETIEKPQRPATAPTEKAEAGQGGLTSSDLDTVDLSVGGQLRPLPRRDEFSYVVHKHKSADDLYPEFKVVISRQNPFLSISGHGDTARRAFVNAVANLDRKLGEKGPSPEPRQTPSGQTGGSAGRGFYTAMVDADGNTHAKKVKGTPTVIDAAPDEEFFVYRQEGHPNHFVVVHRRTGASVSSSGKTRKEAIDSANQNIRTHEEQSGVHFRKTMEGMKDLESQEEKPLREESGGPTIKEKAPTEPKPKETEHADTAATGQQEKGHRGVAEELPPEGLPENEGSRDAGAVREGTGSADVGGVPPGGRGRTERVGGRENPGNRRGNKAVQDQAGDEVVGDIPPLPAGDGGTGRGGEPGGGKRERVKKGSDYIVPVGGLKREGSWLDTARRNVDIIELALKIQGENRPATPEEQAQLSKYVGFGAGEIRNKLFPTNRDASLTQIWPNYGIYDKTWQGLAERLSKLPEEWQRTILQSTQYAHYTSENITRQMWEAARHLGFTGGKVLEPGMGIGNFFMTAPDDIRTLSSYTGIEFDGPTALVAQLLLPRQHVLHDDYTKRKLPREFFDFAIGNPPFSSTKITNDRDYAKHEFSLHDYFFAKTVDLVRPGGMVAFVTSRHTMDRQGDRARRYMMDRADLIGAIRLPQMAFQDNAGTSVVTDVMFFRKRMEGEAPAGQPWSKIVSIDTKDGPVGINEYYADHPEMILGQVRKTGHMDDQGNRIGGERGYDQPTVISYYGSYAELDDAFAKAVKKLPANVFSVMKKEPESIKRETAAADFNPKIRREGALYLDEDGIVRRVQSGVGVDFLSTADIPTSRHEWFRDFVGLKDAVNIARHDQYSDGPWEKSLADLKKAYEEFREKHGPILDYTTRSNKKVDEEGNEYSVQTRVFKNKRFWDEDYDSALVRQLERITEEGDIVPADFLNRRTIGKPVQAEVKTIHDALAVSLDANGVLDLDDIASRMGMGRNDAIEALEDLIYKDPSGDKWVMSDEYLSGDVVRKLEEARAAADVDPSLNRNVKALLEVQPKPLTHAEIRVLLGAGWVPDQYVSQFADEVLGAGEVTYDKKTETWSVTGGNKRSDRVAGHEWGTDDRSSSEILEAVLNGRRVIVRRTESLPGGGKTTYTDTAATEAVNDIMKKMKQKFSSWIWTDSGRTTDILNIYNTTRNNLAKRRFNGSHLTLPGMSMKYQLYDHQKRVIWRIIQTGNTYLAHSVGSGKTMEMIAAGMEMRRLGMVKRPWYVVPNHMLEQFSNEFMDLYPLANIMVADNEAFHKDKRKAFVAQATLNDPDAVIVTHSAFERVGVHEESVAPIRNRLIEDLEEALAETDKDERIKRSALQKQIESLERRFDAIVGADQKDVAITFEETGCDFLFVDEAHQYRKLDFTTNRKIKGVDPNGSRRAMDMFVKTTYLNSKSPGRSHVFASGTPLTNTIGELYSIMKFFMSDQMEQDGISTFDGWASSYGDSQIGLEPNAAGNYENVERFSTFVNIPELMKMVGSFMDVLTSSQLGAVVKRPDIEGGKPEIIVVPSTPEQKAYREGPLTERVQRSKAWKPSFSEKSNPDPIIAIISEGRKASIDPRFFDPSLPEDTPSKLNRMADEIIAEYKSTSHLPFKDITGKVEKKKGGGQIIFYNLGFGAQIRAKGRFDARHALTKRLIEGGIKRDEIAWFDDADTDAKKERVFKDARAGNIRVVIGSAKKMGTGVNIQKRLTALHYLDPPWYPADFEQPLGRPIRQGNQNKTVKVKLYATKGSYDETMWSMVSRKQKMIDQALSGDDSVRNLEDISEANSYELAAALASGDQRVIQLAGLNGDIDRLGRLAVAHQASQRKIEQSIDGLKRYQIPQLEGRLERFKQALKLVSGYETYRSGEVAGKTFGDKQKDELGEAIKAAYNRAVEEYGANLKETTQGGWRKVATIGKLNGKYDLEVSARIEAGVIKHAELNMAIGPVTYGIESGLALGDGTSGQGLVTKMVNAANRVNREIGETTDKIEEFNTELKRLQKSLGAPFEYEAELADKIAEKAILENELVGESAAVPDGGREGGPFSEPEEFNERGADYAVREPSENDYEFYAPRTKLAPRKTVTGYKLFRVDKRMPGKLFPLFVNANEPVDIGVWLDAEVGPLTAAGKVKSKLGPLAFRPGWHGGDLPIATHIGEGGQPPKFRPSNQVWAEVEFAADIDWQEEANKRGTNTKGRIVPVRAHITDQIPEDGYYRYKTNPNMTGNWIISGSMKVNKVLTDAEVERINSASGVSDLPRSKPMQLEDYGFKDSQHGRRLTREQIIEQVSTTPANISAASGTVDRHGGVATLGLAIRQDLINKEVVDLRGKTVKSHRDIALVWQVARNPEIEVFHVVYTKGGKVVAHEAISSRLPGSTKPFVDWSRPAKSRFEMINRMKRLGADGYYLVHNHPAGDPKPSPEDLENTAKIARDVPGFKGHVVINSGKYAFISLDPKAKSGATFKINAVPKLPADWTDELLSPSIPHPLLNQNLLDTHDAVRFAKMLQSPEGIVAVIYRDSNGRVRAVQEVPEGMFINVDGGADFIRGRMRAFGAGSAVAAVRNPSIGFAQNFGEFLDNNTFEDIIYGWDDYTESAVEQFGDKGRDRKLFSGQSQRTQPGIRFREDQAPYSTRAEEDQTGDDGEPSDDEQPLGSRPFKRRASSAKPGGPTYDPVSDQARRSAIIKLLSDAFGVPTRIGRFRQKALGIFKHREKVVRLKKANDVEVAVHEYAHYFEKLLGMPVKMPDEIRDLAYTGATNKNREGFAEFVRLYVTQQQEAMASAPNFYSYFEGALNKFPDVRDVLIKARELWEEYQAAPSVSKVMSFIRSGNEIDKGKRTTFGEMYTKIYDELEPIRAMVREAEKAAGREIKSSDNPFKLAVLMRGWSRKAEQYAKYGTFQLDDKAGVVFTGDPLMKIIKPIEDAGERKLFDAYLFAKRAVNDERIIKGFEGVLSRADLEQTVKELEPRFKDHAEKLYEYSDNLLAYLVSSGRISAQDAADTAARNVFYAPLYRVMEDTPFEVKGGTGKSVGNAPNPLKRLKGSSRDIHSPTENILYNTYAFINAAERNRIGRALIGISKIEGMGKFIEHVPVKMKAIGITGEELTSILKKYGEWRTTTTHQETQRSLGQKISEATEDDNLSSNNSKARDVALEALRARGWSEAEANQVLARIRNTADQKERIKIIEETIEKSVVTTIMKEFGLGDIADQVMNVWRPNYRTAPNEVIFYNNGEPEVYELSPEIYEAIMNTDSTTLSGVTKLLHYPAQAVRAGATTFSLGFSIRNPFRDQLTAFLQNRYGYTPGIDLIRGIFHVANKTDIYQKYNASGAAHAAIVSIDREYLSKNLDRLYEQYSRRIGPKFVIGHPLQAIQMLSELMEEGTRVGAFGKALKKTGLDLSGLMDAGIEGRDITTDFQRKGSSKFIKTWRFITTFFGAGLQGPEKMVRTMKERPFSILKALITLTIPSIALYLMQKDDEYYQEIPRWRRIWFWNVVTHKPDGSLNHIWSFPKPFEWGILFGSVPELALQWWQKNDKDSFDEGVKALAGAFIPPFIPAMVAPLIEQWANKSFFFDRPILPRGKEELSPRLQYSHHTPETLKLIAEQMAKVPGLDKFASPARMDHLIYGYTAGLGNAFLNISDTVLRQLGLIDYTPMPSMTAADIPGLKAFVARFPSESALSIERFYDRYAEAKREYEDSREEAGLRGLGSLTRKIKAPSGMKPDNLPMYEAAAKMLSALRTTCDLIYRDKTMDSDEKREKLDNAYLSMINIARGALGEEPIETTGYVSARPASARK